MKNNAALNKSTESGNLPNQKNIERKSSLNGGEVIRLFVNCKNLKLKEDIPYDSYEFAEINALISFNIKGYSLLLQFILKNMLTNKHGAIINIIRGNQHSIFINNSQCLYSSGSEFITSLSNYTRRLYKKEGINVLNAYYPGEDEEKRREELVLSSLKYIGVKDSISI